MNREELLKNKEYVVSQIQLNLLNLIGNYQEKNNLKDFQLADELGVSKSYISQLLNVTFDHKISKLVDLALACNTMPLIYFVDLNEFIQKDREDKVYELFPVNRRKNMTFEVRSNPSLKVNYSFQEQLHQTTKA
jgi:transcriptional regulator with XRE-family HTH domain